MMSDDILAPADWSFPVPIHYGPGRIAELGTLCRNLGIARPLVVTDSGSRTLPFIAQAQESLRAADLMSALFADIAPNPTDKNVEAGRAAFRAGDHDGVIAIGGGSGMDGAKAISLTAWNDRALLDFSYDKPVSSEAVGTMPPLMRKKQALML